jgi:hypothetical protein
MDVVEKATFKTSEQACEFYEVAKGRLLDVNHWAEISNLPSATFRLCGPGGEEVNRQVKKGDFFKINIPGPGNSSGEGFDWVQVELIQEEQESSSDILSIRVRPASNPQNAEPAVAHFFSDKATSTFQVRRTGKEVSAEVHGRNEKPNTETGHILDNARNTMVGLGATLGMSFPQWKGLVAGLVKVY